MFTSSSTDSSPPRLPPPSIFFFFFLRGDLLKTIYTSFFKSDEAGKEKEACWFLPVQTARRFCYCWEMYSPCHANHFCLSLEGLEPVCWNVPKMESRRRKCGNLGIRIGSSPCYAQTRVRSSEFFSVCYPFSATLKYFLSLAVLRQLDAVSVILVHWLPTPFSVRTRS